jgi:hypothetical protein
MISYNREEPFVEIPSFLLDECVEYNAQSILRTSTSSVVELRALQWCGSRVESGAESSGKFKCSPGESFACGQNCEFSSELICALRRCESVGEKLEY